ncbi:sulfatase family protein [Flavilitoribacter nigricans]|uniref:Heparan N-sulfatase n=1 Tax=Flavilitoribacter nigricans (strain ATCC 23147 / DSM 23189 / NBRC 102662 / NCIMB 1420 / SS-2) TaxID=1122177 RepID=A0A2D0ND44_FLAN2|nr:sulfatase [Flavilitoribacter nigricans]PHN05693.1 heparan N-sulfatase [Flavilitoribacter nigricans DSM 23189 = NBRC 102662]
MSKYIFFLLPVLGLLTGCSSSDTETTDTPPNLILIIADDMAWDDSGAYGHPSIRTPNIDRLAREGMRFDQAFLTTSSCSPSRASIITGTYPHQTDAEQLHWPVPADKLTFVEKLKAHGYWTALAGKYHLGDALKDRFDLIAAVGTSGFVMNADGPAEEAPEKKEDGSGCENWLATFQQRPADQPFFLWLAAVDPHRPYTSDIVAEPHRAADVIVPPYLPDVDTVREDFARYYDEIHRMDDYIGQLMDALEKSGEADNTVVLFISDNGRPFPRDKTTLYDGGIKTPWIVRWPAAVKAGTTTASMVSAVDIAPTFLSLAGAEVPPVFEGVDFSPVLHDPSATVRDWIYAEDHWHDFEDYTRAVRDQDYKYIRNFYPDLPNTPPADALRSPTFAKMLQMRAAGTLNDAQLACFREPRPEEELYDTRKDPHELVNLAGDPAFAETLAQLRTKMEAIRQETGDILPARRTPDEFTRYSGQPLPVRKRPRPSKAEMELSSTE